MGKYKDFPIELTAENLQLSDAEVIVQNLKRLLTTELGTVLDDKLDGTELDHYLYELMEESTAGFIELEVYSCILRNEPRVTQLSVEVKTDLSNQRYIIYIKAYIEEFDADVDIEVERSI